MNALSKKDPALLERLSEADRRWQQVKGRALIWRTVPLLLALVLAAFATDAFLQLGPVPRFAWILSGFAMAVLAGLIIWHIGWFRRNSPERIARFLETRQPELGSRLINGLQLTAQLRDQGLPDGTRKFARMAVERYDAELAPLDLPAITETGEDRQARLWTIWGVVIFALLLAAFFPVVKVVAPRFLDPWGDHPPYSFTQVEIISPVGTVDVVYGATLTVRAQWSGHEPRELFVTARGPGNSNSVTLPMIRDGEHTFFQEIADVRSDLTVTVHGKDWKFFSKQHEARVLLTPKIDKAFIEVIPPEYTGLASREYPFTFKATSALEGSNIRFRLHSNRPLREGKVDILREGNGATSIPLLLSATHEVTGTVPISEAARLRFQVTDVDGLVSAEQPETMVSVTHDLAPTVRMVEPEQDGFVSVAFDLTAKVQASDDYGVRTIRIHQALNGTFSEPHTLRVEGVQRDVSDSLPVDFHALGAKPGDTIGFYAEAIDTAPSPHLARSQTVTLKLISEEEYNDFLREEMDVRMLSEKYSELVERFDKLRDEQIKLAAQAQKLADRRVDPQRKTEEFDALTARQNEINQRIDKLAGEMEQFVRDKPVYDFEKDLQRELREEAGEMKRATSFNDQAMKDLVKETTPEGGDRALSQKNVEQLVREAKSHAERLGARTDSLAENLSKPLEDLSGLHDMMNDFNLFEELYNEQKRLAEQSAQYQSKKTLSREDQLALKDFAASQEEVRDALSQLPGMLRKHASAGGEKFPKAAASCNAMADAIEQGRLEPKAANAGERLLAGDGENGAALTARLEAEMKDMFSKCKGQGGEQDELDQYLSLKLPGGAKGNSLEQMRKSRRNGLNSGRRFGRGRGEGSGSGYSMSRSELPVLGNERFNPNGPKQSSRTNAKGSQGNGTPGTAEAAPLMDKPDVLKNITPSQQQSDAVQGESTIDQYRTVVDEYIKKVTKP